MNKEASERREKQIEELKETLKKMPAHKRKAFIRGWVQADKRLRRK